MKWNELYNTEDELIKAMFETKSDINKYPQWKIVKGYVYIESFKKYYNKNGKLTDKQMTQLKRLAPEIHKNTTWDCYK